jgi:hypothetical protein
LKLIYKLKISETFHVSIEIFKNIAEAEKNWLIIGM